MVRLLILSLLTLCSFEALSMEAPSINLQRPQINNSQIHNSQKNIAKNSPPKSFQEFMSSRNIKFNFEDAPIARNAKKEGSNLKKEKHPNINKLTKDERAQLQNGNPRVAIFTPKSYTPNRLFSAELSRPINFISSNNLIKKAGSFYQARGEVVRLTGRVIDSFGVPISGAVIEIWQTNASGKYQSLLEKNSEFMDAHFNMSGRAITDNLGRYHFLTIMPGSYLNRAPHINMDVYHKQFGKIETEMYFENHPKNEVDYEYLSYDKSERELLTSKVKLSNMFDKKSYKICTFDIVMNGVHKYKSFGGEV